MTTGSPMQLDGALSDGDDRYLVFKVGDESLAAPLLSIREIVEPLAYRPTRSPDSHYLGLSNLRGQIVGVVDMGLRLGLSAVWSEAGGVFLIVDAGGTSMAAYVSKVEAVLTISESAIKTGCQLDMIIPTDSLFGIAQLENRILPIVDVLALVEAKALS